MTTSNKIYLQLLEEARKEKLKINKDTLLKTKKLYKEVIKDLQKRIKSTNNYNNKFVKAQIRILEQELREMDIILEREVTMAITDTSLLMSSVNADFYSMLDKEYNLHLSTDMLSSMYSTNNRVIQKIVGGGLYKDKRSLSERVWKYSEKNISDIQDILVKGIIERKSLEQLCRELSITIGSLTIVENTGTESANYEITFVPEKVRVINVVPPAAEENDGGSSSAKRNTAAAISAVNNPDLTSSIYMMASGTFSTEYQNPAMIGMILSAAAAPRHVEQSGFSGSISARYANEEHSAAHIDIRDEIRADRENRAVLESARADGDVLFDGALCHQEDDLRKRLNDIPVQIDSFALFDSFSVDMADSDTGLYWSEEIAGSLPDDRIAENVSGMEDDGMAGVENIRFTMLLNHALPCRDELDEALDALCVVS